MVNIFSTVYALGHILVLDYFLIKLLCKAHALLKLNTIS